METFDEIEQLVASARTPEAIFGPLQEPQERALRQRYHALLGVAHPDRQRGNADRAHQLCTALQRWLELAQSRLADGSYGQVDGPVVTSSTRRYHCAATPIQGELCDLYRATGVRGPVLLKAVRAPRNNDLLAAEATALELIARQLDGQRVRAHFGRLVEQLTLRDAAGVHRAVNVLSAEPDTYSVADIVRARPAGIPPQDMAWMFNRLLAALATTHSLGLVHGAVVPEHLLIRPADHNGILIDWCYSVPMGGTVKAISPANAAAYPPEITDRQAATPATDLYMAAHCMCRLLGADSAGNLPPAVPAPIRRLLAACLIRSPHRRVADAWQLFDDFREILARLYGPPVFRHFELAA